jgi:uncharacterized metal-binding protein
MKLIQLVQFLSFLSFVVPSPLTTVTAAKFQMMTLKPQVNKIALQQLEIQRIKAGSENGKQIKTNASTNKKKNARKSKERTRTTKKKMTDANMSLMLWKLMY